MTWTRFVPGFSRHPKRRKCGPLASWLWACSVDHCTEYLTDGFVDEAVIADLCPGLRGQTLVACIEKLIAVQSWERVPGGIFVKGYLDHNPSRGKVEAERDAARRRYERWRGQRDDNAVATPLEMRLQRVSNETSVSQSVSQLCTTNYVGESEPTTLNPHPPPDKVVFQVPVSIAAALDRAPTLGGIERLRVPDYWQAEVRANPGVNYSEEILKAEAWLKANPERAPRKNFPRFLHTWLGRAHRNGVTHG